MALTDPTGGTGYAVGQKLPSAHMTTLATQAPRGLDAVNGGTYACDGAITVNNAGSGSITYGSSLNVTWTGTSNLPKLGSRTYLRAQPLIINYTTVGGAGAGIPDWIYSGTAGEEGAILHNFAYTTASEAFFYLPLTNLIDKATLTRIDLQVDPGGHGSDPARKIKAGLYKLDATGAGLIGSVTEDDLTGASYDANHIFDITGYTEAIDQTTDGCTYYLKILGEGGANAINGTLIRRCFCYFTVTQVTPGG